MSRKPKLARFDFMFLDLFWVFCVDELFISVLRVLGRCVWSWNGLKNSFIGKNKCWPNFSATTTVAKIWACKWRIIYLCRRCLVDVFYLESRDERHVIRSFKNKTKAKPMNVGLKARLCDWAFHCPNTLGYGPSSPSFFFWLFFKYKSKRKKLLNPIKFMSRITCLTS